MKKPKEKMPDTTAAEFWDGLGFRLVEVTGEGVIRVVDLSTNSEMEFATSWTAFRIAKVVSNARAQYLK